LARRPIPGDLQRCDVIFYNDSGVKSPGCGTRLAYCTKKVVRKTNFVYSIVRSIPL